jgi:hypothetical protein
VPPSGPAASSAGAPSGWVTPLAWSPDQTRLAVSIADASIGLLSLDTGAYTPVLPYPSGLTVSPRTPVVAAFSADGTLAVQLDTKVCAGARCFTLPAGQRLAGKGALAPGGAFLAVVADAGRDSRITFVSAVDGTPVPGTVHLYGVTTLRLIGWWGQRALVVAFRPEPVTDLGPLDDEKDYRPTDYRLVRRLSVLAVTPSSSPSSSSFSSPSSSSFPSSSPASSTASPADSQELIALPDQVLSIDIADHALAAGHTTPGRAAPVWPARPGVLTALVGLPAAPIAFVVFLAGAIRRERAAASTTR